MDEAKSSTVHLHKPRQTRSAPTANRECALAVGADRAAGRSARTDQGDACATSAAGPTAATLTGHRSASPPAAAPPSASAPGSPASCTSYTSCAASLIAPARAAAGAPAVAATAAGGAASAAAAAAIAAADMAVPSPKKGKRKAPNARPPFGSPDVLAQLLALERGACDGGTPATPRIGREARRGSPPGDELDWEQPEPQQGAAARQLASEVRGAQEAAPAAPTTSAPATPAPASAATAAPAATAADGAERRAAYWRSSAISGRDAAARSAPSLAPRNAARAGRGPDVELEQCTFAPRLNTHSLRIEATRHAATGALRAHPHPHRLRNPMHIACAPPSTPPPHRHRGPARLTSSRRLWQVGSGSRNCTGRPPAQVRLG